MAAEVDLYDRDDSFVNQSHMNERPSDALRKMYGSNYCFVFVDETFSTADEAYQASEKRPAITIDMPMDRDTEIQPFLDGILKKKDKRTQCIEFPRVLKQVQAEKGQEFELVVSSDI